MKKKWRKKRKRKREKKRAIKVGQCKVMAGIYRQAQAFNLIIAIGSVMTIRNIWWSLVGDSMRLGNSAGRTAWMGNVIGWHLLTLTAEWIWQVGEIWREVAAIILSFMNRFVSSRHVNLWGETCHFVPFSTDQVTRPQLHSFVLGFIYWIQLNHLWAHNHTPTGLAQFLCSWYINNWMCILKLQNNLTDS